MKKFDWVLLALIIFVVSFAVFFGYAQAQYDPWFEEPQTGFVFQVVNPAVGDINKDGVVGPADILMLNKIMDDIHLYDLNGDLKVNDKDIQYLVNFVYSAGDPPIIATRCRNIRVERNCDTYMQGDWTTTPEAVRESQENDYPAYDGPTYNLYDQPVMVPLKKDTTTKCCSGDKCCQKP